LGIRAVTAQTFCAKDIPGASCPERILLSRLLAKFIIFASNKWSRDIADIMLVPYKFAKHRQKKYFGRS